MSTARTADDLQAQAAKHQKLHESRMRNAEERIQRAAKDAEHEQAQLQRDLDNFEAAQQKARDRIARKLADQIDTATKLLKQDLKSDIVTQLS